MRRPFIWQRCERLGMACESSRLFPPGSGVGVLGYATSWPAGRAPLHRTSGHLNVDEGHAYLDLVEHFSRVLVDMPSYHDKLAVEGDERP